MAIVPRDGWFDVRARATWLGSRGLRDGQRPLLMTRRCPSGSTSEERIRVHHPAARKSGRGRALLLCGTVFLEGSDVAMLAVAVPTMRADLGLTTGTAASALSGYVLGYAGFTLLGGRSAGLLGRRRMLLTWLGVFLVFSMLGGFAIDGWMLVVARLRPGRRGQRRRRDAAVRLRHRSARAAR
ncbi:MFS transporter [Streptomyces sp. NPDC001292]|uniref:MFS transporter n=1 Tax=Streptomyces sp. NPDC001292 TaxID=3364558 RepID=UPI0036F29FE6